MVMPKGHSLTKAKADLRRRALAVLTRYCLAEKKRSAYFWETIPFSLHEHDQDGEKNQAEFNAHEETMLPCFNALVESVKDNVKKIRWSFIKGHKSLRKFVTRELHMFDTEGKLTQGLLNHELLRYKIVRKNGKVIDLSLADIEEIEQAMPKEKQVTYKFIAAMTPEELHA